MAEMYKQERIEKFIQRLELRKQAMVNQLDQPELADLHHDLRIQVLDLVIQEMKQEFDV